MRLKNERRISSRNTFRREIPIPIEEVVEVDMGIEIFPIPAFFIRYGIVGYLSNDMNTLVVDEDTMKRYPARYRFTLAHELAHYLLHADYIRQEFPEDESKRRIVPTFHFVLN